MGASESEIDSFNLMRQKRGHQASSQKKNAASRYVHPPLLFISTVKAVKYENDRRKTSLQKWSWSSMILAMTSSDTFVRAELQIKFYLVKSRKQKENLRFFKKQFQTGSLGVLISRGNTLDTW